MAMFISDTCMYLLSGTKLRRLCFYTCLSVYRGSTWAGASLGTRYTPSAGTRYTPPWDQVHPLEPGTPPPGTRYTPSWDQVHPSWDQVPPRTRCTLLPGPGTHPPGIRYTPWDQVSSGTRYTPRTRCPPGPGIPPDQVHPLGPGTPQEKATVADGTHPTGMHSCFGGELSLDFR